MVVGNSQHGNEGVHLGVTPTGGRPSLERLRCRRGVRAEAGPPAFKEKPRWRLGRSIQGGRRKTEGRRISPEGGGKGDSGRHCRG